MPESHSETTKLLTENEIAEVERQARSVGLFRTLRLIATIRSRDERIRALEWAARRAVREFRQRGNKDH